MSIIRPCFVIMINLLICFLDLVWAIRNLRVLSSRAFFMRDVSMIILFDCFKAFFIRCSNELAVGDFGDLISYSTPSNKMSAVCKFDSSRNSMSCPAIVRISATRNSWGQSLRPDAMNVPFFRRCSIGSLYHTTLVEQGKFSRG